jgi:hypothetical protein
MYRQSATSSATLQDAEKPSGVGVRKRLGARSEPKASVVGLSPCS